MLLAAFVKRYDRRRLRAMLGILFAVLVLPTGFIVWQAYDQLKWESWYQYRSQAEALAMRIDAELGERVSLSEARSFTDYAFLNATANASVLNRSPLSALPVPEDLPGVIGYFQVDPEGAFSTPLLPASGEWLESGLTPEEYAARTRLETELRSILAGNQLLRDGMASGGRLQAPAVAPQPAREERASAPGPGAIDQPAAVTVTVTDAADDVEPQARLAQARLAEEAEMEAPAEAYAQRMFDQLNAPLYTESAAPQSAPAAALAVGAADDNAGNVSKLRDLQLDDALEKKNEELARQADEPPSGKKSAATEQVRARRVEQSVLPAAPAEVADADRELDRLDNAITTFESEIDPFQFSLLDSGHLVLFRNVWRNGSRYIQGLLIDQPAFLEAVIDSAFRSTTLFDMSDLVIGYHDDVIRLIRGGNYASLQSSAGEFDGALLYRGSLSAPFDRLELVFSINRLPPGPGAKVLGWSALVIAAVFVGGFISLYRLGLGQIRLARQQQDFVSAVSHELKTPLTSIRMYGEMLKEGWADEEKQKQYYEFIHDESERLTRLISNVLQLSRITRNEPQFDARPVSVGKLLDQVRSKISSQVERAGFDLEFAVDDDAVDRRVEVDDDCFAQIVINLVDNAIKFAKNAPTKKIEISCRVDAGDKIVFRVRDFGPGIDKSQLKKIFRLFYRTESELTRETAGTGIGLAIVHQLVTAMGGSVDVVNCDPGAEFQVAFPAAGS